MVQIGNENLVFDFGRGCINQLLKLGIEYHDLAIIFISHTHADHCAELSPFLQIALQEPPEGKFRKKDATIYGPKGIKQTVRNLLKAFHMEDKKPRYKVKVKELKEGEIVKGKNWFVKCFKATHAKKRNCLSYRVENNNKVFSYSGDNSYCKGLIDCCKDADLAIIEANSPTSLEMEGHLTGEKTGKIAQEANVKTLVLTHLSVYYKENFDVKKEAKSFFKGPIIIAKDMMQFQL